MLKTVTLEALGYMSLIQTRQSLYSFHKASREKCLDGDGRWIPVIAFRASEETFGGDLLRKSHRKGRSPQSECALTRPLPLHARTSRVRDHFCFFELRVRETGGFPPRAERLLGLRKKESPPI